VTGNALVVVNGSSDPFGQGWSVAGFDALVPVTGGGLYVAGTGGARFFRSLGSGPFLSPAHDLRTPTPVGTTYTYTTKDQVKETFDNSGNLLTVTDPHNLTVTYSYSGGNLQAITGPDGGAVTFSYSSGKLSSAAEPGGRTVTVTVDGNGDLTN